MRRASLVCPSVSLSYAIACVGQRRLMAALFSCHSVPSFQGDVSVWGGSCLCFDDFLSPLSIIFQIINQPFEK